MNQKTKKNLLREAAVVANLCWDWRPNSFKFVYNNNFLIEASWFIRAPCGQLVRCIIILEKRAEQIKFFTGSPRYFQILFIEQKADLNRSKKFGKIQKNPGTKSGVFRYLMMFEKKCVSHAYVTVSYITVTFLKKKRYPELGTMSGNELFFLNIS